MIIGWPRPLRSRRRGRSRAQCTIHRELKTFRGDCRPTTRSTFTRERERKKKFHGCHVNKQQRENVTCLRTAGAVQPASGRVFTIGRRTNCFYPIHPADVYCVRRPASSNPVSVGVLAVQFSTLQGRLPRQEPRDLTQWAPLLRCGALRRFIPFRTTAGFEITSHKQLSGSDFAGRM